MIMEKPTFKQFHNNPELYENDESRVKQLRDAVKRGVPGSVEKMDMLLATLKKRGAIKGDIERTAKDYESWKEGFRNRRNAFQKDKDNQFANAKAQVQAADNDQGSDAFKREAGSIRRSPKGSMGTLGTIPTR